MIPDITIKDYYLQFIHDAKKDIEKYKENLDRIIELKEKLYEYIKDNKDVLLNTFNINLNKAEIEFQQKTYNPKEYLYRLAIKALKDNGNIPKRVVLLHVAKYCNVLRNEDRYIRLINLTNRRKDIKFATYRKYVAAYYNKVHKCVLSGMGYKFSYGIGTYVINHWKLNPKRVTRRIIDFAATNSRKRELLAKGVKLYDDKEAAWYAARRIPYNAVDYRVYKDSGDWYEITFIKSDIFRGRTLDYQKSEYIATKYRGMSYTQMADELCHTEEDVYNLQVDIKYKLNILLYKDPTKYLNYVRNAEQSKYKYRANNSQD